VGEAKGRYMVGVAEMIRCYRLNGEPMSVTEIVMVKVKESALAAESHCQREANVDLHRLVGGSR
jgi:hypothetical protein